MGRDAMAVVDERLRVHGVQGLRVVDCSAMPTLVSGNTNAAAVMMAEKAADMIRQDARQALTAFQGGARRAPVFQQATQQGDKHETSTQPDPAPGAGRRRRGLARPAHWSPHRHWRKP